MKKILERIEETKLQLNKEFNGLDNAEVLSKTTNTINEALEELDYPNEISHLENFGSDYLYLEDYESVDSYLKNRASDNGENWDISSLLHALKGINHWAEPLLSIDGYGNLQDVNRRNLIEDCSEVLEEITKYINERGN